MKLKDNSTLSCCEYVFIYILTAIITGFIFRFTSSKILPVKYMFAQNITICITYVIVTVISIAITYRTERTKTAIVRNIMATICLITLMSMAGRMNDIVMISCIVVAVTSVVQMLPIIKRKTKNQQYKKLIIKARVNRCYRILTRNMAVSVLILCVLVPLVFRGFAPEEYTKDTRFLEQFSDLMYSEKDVTSKYEVRKVYGAEYSINDKKALELMKPIVNSRSWKKLDDDKKKAAIEAVAYNIAWRLGVDRKISITYADLGEAVGGYYDSDTDVICVSTRTFEMENDEVFKIIAHEVRHCYQSCLTDIYDKLTPEQRSLAIYHNVREWADNENNYASGENESLKYYTQPIEQDAYEYADAIWTTFSEEIKEAEKNII